MSTPNWYCTYANFSVSKLGIWKFTSINEWILLYLCWSPTCIWFRRRFFVLLKIRFWISYPPLYLQHRAFFFCNLLRRKIWNKLNPLIQTKSCWKIFNNLSGKYFRLIKYHSLSLRYNSIPLARYILRWFPYK